MLPLAACGGDDGAEEPQDGRAASEEFEPVTVEHAFGGTEVTERPERVVTWGWGTPDAVLALGVVPVAMEKLSYGASEDGFMPWQEEALEELDAEQPTALTPGEAPPFEEIAAAAPDVILASYSGITEADYDKLTRIAPTVAYPDEPWSTPWREVITTVGEVLGQGEDAEEVLDDIDAEVAAAAEAHPEFDGTTIAAVAIDPSAFYVYSGADPRVQFLEDLGFKVAPSVDDLDTGESTFYYTLSTENVDRLTSDVLLSYAAVRGARRRDRRGPDVPDHGAAPGRPRRDGRRRGRRLVGLAADRAVADLQPRHLRRGAGRCRLRRVRAAGR